MEEYMATKIFTPQRVYGLKKLTISEAKTVFNEYVDSISFLPTDLKNKIKNSYRTSDTMIQNTHNVFKELKQFFNTNQIKELGVSYSNGDMFEIIAPLIKYNDTDTIKYLKSGAIGIDCVINDVDNVQIKYDKGVNGGIVSFINSYRLIKSEFKTSYYDSIYNALFPLSKSRGLNIFNKLFSVLNNIGKSIYINGVEVTKDIQTIICKYVPQKDDTDKGGTRKEKIKELYDFMTKTFGNDVFDIYETSYEENYPLWESYKNGNGKKPQKCHLDYKKYDAFTLHMVYNLFEKMLNECYIKEINDFVKFVAEHLNVKLLKCDEEKLIFKDMKDLEFKVDSWRYYGELNFHGGGTISLEFLGV
jgi:hypothetical protein